MNRLESSAAEPTSRRLRYHFTAREWSSSILFLATVVVFGLAPLLALLLIFSLFFNRYTIGPIFFFFGWLAFRHGFTEYRNRLAISGTATATASSAAIGLVELSGRGYAENPSEAPITKKLCAFWKVEVRHRNKNDFRWVDVLWRRVMERSSGRLDAIELEDDTGRILVWPRGAEMIPIKQVWRSDRGGDPPEGVLRLVAALGLQWPSRWARYPMRSPKSASSKTVRYTSWERWRSGVRSRRRRKGISPRSSTDGHLPPSTSQRGDLFRFPRHSTTHGRSVCAGSRRISAPCPPSGPLRRWISIRSSFGRAISGVPSSSPVSSNGRRSPHCHDARGCTSWGAPA